MKKTHLLILSGIWIYPISLATVYLLYQSLNTLLGKNGGYNIALHFRLWLIAFVPVVVIFLMNIYLLLTHRKNDFSFRGYFNRSVITPQKWKAQHPTVDPGLLAKKPEGMLYGKYQRQYFRVLPDINKVRHTFVLGPSGSGKSSMLIASLQANFMQAEPPMTVMAVDIKPELAIKSVELDNPNIIIVGTEKEYQYGWDPYYAITAHSSDDKVLDTMKLIVDSLIGSSAQYSFFTEGAKNIFIGLLMYYFRSGLQFISSVRRIRETKINEQVVSALEDFSLCPDGSTIRSLLTQYADMDGEAIQNMQANIANPLMPFLRENIGWLFEGNHKKASPLDLENKKSIFLCFPEESLKNYDRILNLILSQTLDYLQGRSDKAKNIINLIIDELPRLHRLDIIESIGTLRSRKCALTLCAQDLSQLHTIYSEAETKTLFNNCKVKILLDCDDVETCETLSKRIGNYQEVEDSFTTRRFERTVSNTSRSVDKRIYEVSELMQLALMDEMLVGVDSKYYRIKKIHYYDDAILKERYREVCRINSIEP